MYNQSIKPIIYLIQLQFVNASGYVNRITEYKAEGVDRDYLVHIQALELPLTPDKHLTTQS